MRSLRFIPLAFLAGAHGFALFAPYLAVAMAVTHLLWARRRKAAWAVACGPTSAVPPLRAAEPILAGQLAVP